MDGASERWGAMAGVMRRPVRVDRFSGFEPTVRPVAFDSAIDDEREVIVVGGEVLRDRRNHHRRPKLGRRHLRVKRCCDVVLALAALAVLWPLMLVIAIAVRVTSRGPVVFRQQRVGRGGREFDMLKFRTMVHGMDEMIRRDPELWAIYVANDHKLPPGYSRYTKIGPFLRRTSLDELPQLFNVLRGDMSIVGIRPIEATQLALRPGSSQRLYSLLAPGVTGLWQVEGRSAVLGDERIELDERYVREWNLARDLRILLQTPAAVVRTDEAH